MKLLTTLLLIVSTAVCFQASANLSPYIPTGGGEPLPWPWGSECPFPWSQIEGMWMATSPEQVDALGEQKVLGYYEFKIVNEWHSGTRVVDVLRYSPTGVILGKGRGYAPVGQKILRAIILAEEGTGYPNHRVIVRAYNYEKAALSCGGALVTVLTTRPMDGNKDEDSHYVLHQMKDRKNTPNNK